MALNDLTVVILSRGREEILRNTLSFWSNKAVNVLVLHNTQNPLASGDIPDNVSYIVEKISYGERCGLVPKYLKTSYAILSSDDEIFLPGGLNTMINELEKNRTLESIGGSAIAVGKYGPRTTGTHCYRNMEGYANLKRSAKSRLLEHFNPKKPWRGGAIYRVLSRELFTKMMKMFHEMSAFSTPYIFEVSGEILINSSGKTRYLTEIYWIRNWIIEPVSHRSWDREIYFNSWMSDSIFNQEVCEWKKVLRKFVELNPEDLSQILENVLTLRHASESREIERRRTFRLPLPNYVKYLLRKATKTAMPKEINETLSDMENLGIKFSYHEVNEAIETITP